MPVANILRTLNIKIIVEQFKILPSSQYQFDLLVLESLIIKSTKTNLNSMDSLNLRILQKFHCGIADTYTSHGIYIQFNIIKVKDNTIFYLPMTHNS